MIILNEVKAKIADTVSHSSNFHSFLD